MDPATDPELEPPGGWQRPGYQLTLDVGPMPEVPPVGYARRRGGADLDARELAFVVALIEGEALGRPRTLIECARIAGYAGKDNKSLAVTASRVIARDRVQRAILYHREQAMALAQLGTSEVFTRQRLQVDQSLGLVAVNTGPEDQPVRQFLPNPAAAAKGIEIMARSLGMLQDRQDRTPSTEVPHRIEVVITPADAGGEDE